MPTLIELTAEIVKAHVQSTAMTGDQILDELNKVHAALQGLETGKPAEGLQEFKPAITVKEAFKKNEVICMVCGKGGFKTLARHLSLAHDLKPGEYKRQFGIPSKQSLAAKSYSESRRKMAEERGMADVLAKARETRAAKLKGKKAAPAKPAKKAAPVVEAAKPKAARKQAKPRAAKKSK